VNGTVHMTPTISKSEAPIAAHIRISQERMRSKIEAIVIS